MRSNFGPGGDSRHNGVVERPAHVPGGPGAECLFTDPETMAIGYDSWVHKLTYDLTVESMAELESLVKATGIDCDLNIEGFYHTITRPDYIEYYEEYVNKATALGMPMAKKIKPTNISGESLDITRLL